MLFGLSPLLEGILSRHVVYVLGAGASKDAGLPLYRELLDSAYPNQIRGFLDSLGLTPERRESYESLIKGAESSMSVFRSYGTDVEQLLEKFSLEDQGLYKQLIDHYHALIRAADTIYHSNCLPYLVERLPPLIDALQRTGGTPSIISFNHDLLVEYGMPNAEKLLGLRFSYGLKRGRFTTLEELIKKKYLNVSPPCDYDDEALSNPKTVPFIKLHGSFNWAICAQCAHLVVFGDDIGLHVGAPYRFEGDLFCPKCQGDLGLSVIPPKKAKTILDMAGSWTAARAILRAADTVVFAGYSLPSYDRDALDLFTSAISSDARIEFVNPSSSEMYTHFSLIFPRNDIIPIRMGFLDYLVECLTLHDGRT